VETPRGELARGLWPRLSEGRRPAAAKIGSLAPKNGVGARRSPRLGDRMSDVKRPRLDRAAKRAAAARAEAAAAASSFARVEAVLGALRTGDEGEAAATAGPYACLGCGAAACGWFVCGGATCARADVAPLATKA